VLAGDRGFQGFGLIQGYNVELCRTILQKEAMSAGEFCSAEIGRWHHYKTSLSQRSWYGPVPAFDSALNPHISA
jgi:hypothetical protein